MFPVIFFSLGSASQWTRSSGQATPSPNYDGGIQSMVSQHVYFILFNVRDATQDCWSRAQS